MFFFSRLNRRTCILGSRLRQMTRKKAVTYVLKRISPNPRRPVLKILGLCLSILIFPLVFVYSSVRAPPANFFLVYLFCENSFFLCLGFAAFEHASPTGHRTRSGDQNSRFIRTLCQRRASLEVSPRARPGDFGIYSFQHILPNWTPISACWDAALASRWTSCSSLIVLLRFFFCFSATPKKSFLHVPCCVGSKRKPFCAGTRARAA